MNCAQPADRTSLRTNGQVGVKNLTSYTTGEQALGRSREVDERRVSGGTGWIDWLSTPPGRYMIDWVSRAHNPAALTTQVNCWAGAASSSR